MSGINVSDDGKSAFAAFVSSGSPAAVLSITDEACSVERECKGDAFKDLESLPSEPRYLAIRVRDPKNGPAPLLFVSYVPDAASTRSKMIYASSTNQIYKQLGGSSVFHTMLFWTSIDEVSEREWLEHVEREQMTLPSQDPQVQMGTARNALPGLATSATSGLSVAAPVTADAQAAIERFGERGLIFRITDEQIELEKELDRSQVREALSTTEPRYALLGSTDGAEFVFNCPDGAPVKQRMVYASMRNAFLSHLKRHISITKMSSEVQDETHMSESGECAPNRPRFSRPKRAGR